MNATYPHHPGSKVTGTSRLAAKAVADEVAVIRVKVWQHLVQFPDGLTPDEIADAIGVEHHSVRSRVCELKEQGMVENADERRVNWRSGRLADVVRVKVTHGVSTESENLVK